MTDDLRELLARGVGGVILFSRNYESPAQLADLCREVTAAASRPIIIAVDQEGGRVQRFGLPFTAIPAMRELGRSRDESRVRDIARILARELRACGVTLNLAPVLDVDSNPRNPVIGARSFSHDPHIVARLGAIVIDAFQSEGLAACAKHFPGHGDTSVDSHLDLPRLPHSIERLENIELPPFIAAIEAGVSAIMTAHILFQAIDPTQPATMSPRVIQGLLRDRLGFQGVVISDDLEMRAIADRFTIETAVTRGLRAGVDLFLICHTRATQERAIEALARDARNDPEMRERIERACARLDALASRIAGL